MLGLEKALLFADDRVELRGTLAGISVHLGDKRRIAVYFVDKDILKGVHPVVLSIIEFMATTLVDVEKKGRVYTREVLKSITPEVDGKMFSCDIDRLEG
ncbi:hypothetical protein ADU37_CDS15640 [Thermococcus sp. 2319x1]|uniref:DUF257 family protein n=1 Tax=Thermococcus sp. 2319x1 TaxID=1674923 RepID=UPI00073A6678|nr:DUF257 family protein [Thermococcus sp. 2319x1]ALV63263.1 hypothetical protein ADU37_CDS15640 [Thermococcus sp. 2319x1]